MRAQRFEFKFASTPWSQERAAPAQNRSFSEHIIKPSCPRLGPEFVQTFVLTVQLLGQLATLAAWIQKPIRMPPNTYMLAIWATLARNYSECNQNHYVLLLGRPGPRFVQNGTNISYFGNLDGLALPTRNGHHPSCQN